MDNNREINAAIRSVPLFFDLSALQIEKIGKISDLVELDPGDQPILEGAQLDFLYILLEGEVRVALFVPTRGAVETSKLGPHDILGWSGMTPIVRQRTGTTTALTHCWLIRINATLLASLCEKDHDIGFIIYRRIANVTALSFLTTRLQLMNIIAESK
jgi:CRP-like cAMP-binding protein